MKITFELSPNDEKRFLTLAGAKHAGESSRLAGSKYAGEIIESFLEHEPAFRELAIQATMRYPHFDKGSGLQVLNRVRAILGMVKATEQDY